MADPPPVVLFDGVCRFCDGAVNFIIDRDRRQAFRFAALQSTAGQDLLRKAGLPTDRVDTLVLFEGERASVRSTAALRIARRLRWPWPLLSVLLWIPRPIRDWGYDFIAKRRYRWFGQLDACRLPTPALRQRFLE